MGTSISRNPVGSNLGYYEVFHAQSQPIPSRSYLLESIAELMSTSTDLTDAPADARVRKERLLSALVRLLAGTASVLRLFPICAQRLKKRAPFTQEAK